MTDLPMAMVWRVCRHSLVRPAAFAEDGGPFAEGEIGGDDDRDLLVKAADQVEEELAANLGEGLGSGSRLGATLNPGTNMSDHSLSAAYCAPEICRLVSTHGII